MFKAILVASLLLAGVASQAADTEFCTVKSEKYPELQSGVNKETICRDAIAALTQQTNYEEGSAIELTVVGRETYNVSFSVAYVAPNKSTYLLSGVEDWWPGGDSYFTLIK